MLLLLEEQFAEGFVHRVFDGFGDCRVREGDLANGLDRAQQRAGEGDEFGRPIADDADAHDLVHGVVAHGVELAVRFVLRQAAAVGAVVAFADGDVPALRLAFLLGLADRRHFGV